MTTSAILIFFSAAGGFALRHLIDGWFGRSEPVATTDPVGSAIAAKLLEQLGAAAHARLDEIAAGAIAPPAK